MDIDYAELHTLSNFTFLRGASHPEELVLTAHRLGYRALALTDECSVAGIVRAHLAARECGLHLVVGSELKLEDGTWIVLLAPDRAAYGRLATLLTCGRRAAEKGNYRLTRADVADMAGGCIALLLPDHGTDPARIEEQARWLRSVFGDDAHLAVELLLDGDRVERIALLRAIGHRCGLKPVACGDVHMHDRRRLPLQHTLTAIRLGCTVAEAGRRLHANGERHLRSLARLRRLYPPDLLDNAAAVARRCTFSLAELRYSYPRESLPAGVDAGAHLAELTRAGMARRWPRGAPEPVRRQVERELALIAELRYEAYFLTVHDIVRFARARGILCQGRGSAANSTVCYCLGITEVDPSRMDVLFERFISRERNEPPDIDVDFEHERREEVMQYVFDKYGRDHAALTATVITYRPKSALRDAGKALGLSLEQVDRLAGGLSWWDDGDAVRERVREAGFDPDAPVIGRLLELVGELIGFPRHLSQHTGGFVLSDRPLTELVPIENAAMADRTVIQWDKDDIDAVGLLKVDCLALGMLTAIRRAFELVRDFRGRAWTMATVPAEDPAVYEMICRADTVGVFQIESRAQMAMLPRLRPVNFYDLVIEVAIVRPGPIQGDMVHPYLKRRQGLEPVTYPSDDVRRVLERTLGIPIFQEQVIRLATVAAGFTPGEADGLRRSMAAWRRRGGLEQYEHKLIDGMRERGYSEDYAQRIFNQILGFGEYGFPESHSASFALLVYVSAWLKRHEPAAFTAALLNSQPMGFYAPAQLVQDARRHDVEVRPADIFASDWDCTLERLAGHGDPALRLGLRMVRGLSAAAAERLLAARRERPFASVRDLARRARLDRGDLGALADAGALSALAGHRHLARWSTAGIEPDSPLLGALEVHEARPLLRRPSEGEDIAADYRHLGLTLGRHPLALLRPALDRLGLASSARVCACSHGERVWTAGLVVTRQRPSSASNVIFVTLEDEAGHVNVIVWQRVAERQRRELTLSRLMAVTGEVQREGEVLHLIAHRLEDHSALLGDLTTRTRDFR